MLGLVHRCALDKSPDHFKAFFTASSVRTMHTKNASIRHARQLVDIRGTLFREIERRSALGLVWVYNRLSGDVINIVDTKNFQRRLQMILKQRILAGCGD